MAGVDISVFKVSIGSFGTYIEQFWKHRNLLRDLDKSISDTVTALKDIGIWNDTIIMTYSEFGRWLKKMDLAAPTTVWLHLISFWGIKSVAQFMERKML